MKKKKLMLLPIDRRQIIDLLTGVDVVVMKDGSTRKFSGFPDDMSLEQLYYEPRRDSLILVVSSESFEELPDFAEIPYPIFEDTTTYSKHIRVLLEGR